MRFDFVRFIFDACDCLAVVNHIVDAIVKVIICHAFSMAFIVLNFYYLSFRKVK